MFKRVLFATDLSEASNLPLECVGGWQNLGLSKVTVAHVHSFSYAGVRPGRRPRVLWWLRPLAPGRRWPSVCCK
jgi:hypothetical protein